MQPDDDFIPPQHFDEYRLVRQLGQGAMGRVYLCHDTALDRPVAVKFIRSVYPDSDVRERFGIEARAIARFSHPNVVSVYRLGEFAGRPYLVSEFICGKGLESVAKPLPWQQVLRLGIGLARGLATAHRHKVLHRDIKPANIMLADDGQVKLLDFGLAKLLDSLPSAMAAGTAAKLISNPGSAGVAETLPWAQGPRDSGDAASPSMTAAGALMGTPMYMAPETWLGQPASTRSDVYSLGAVLYELASGNPPHDATSLLTLRRAALEDDARPLAALRTPMDRRFAAIVDRCVRRDPEKRFASGVELLAALEELAQGMAQPRTVPLRYFRHAVIGSVVALFAGGGIWWQVHREPTGMVLIQGGTFTMENQGYLLGNQVGEENLYVISSAKILDSAELENLITKVPPGQIGKGREIPPTLGDKKRGGEQDFYSAQMIAPGIAALRFSFQHQK